MLQNSLKNVLRLIQRDVEINVREGVIVSKSIKVKHKIILWICLLLVLVIVVCVILIKKEERKQSPDLLQPVDSAQNGQEASVAQTTVVSPVQTAKIFTSSSSRFQLLFPSSWGEVNITEQDVEKGGKATLFGFKTTDPKFASGIATAVTIYEYPLSTESKLGISLVGDDNYSYSYLTWEQAPSDHQQITEKELADVLGTFKLIK